jgi:hypothetical protein
VFLGFTLQPACERLEPAQLVSEFFRARRLAIRDIQVDHPEIANGRREDATRRIIEIRDIADEVSHGQARQQGHAVVRLLAAEHAVVTRGRELRMREVRVLHLGFLQGHHVGGGHAWTRMAQPLEQLLTAHPQGVHVPGGNGEAIATGGGNHVRLRWPSGPAA